MDAKTKNLKASALAYQKFLANNPKETKEMAAWEQAPLTRPPTKIKKIKPPRARVKYR
jgi:hypothetical protein